MHCKYWTGRPRKRLSKKMQFVKTHTKQLANLLVEPIGKRFGHIWKQIGEVSALWESNHTEEVEKDLDWYLHEPRRTLQFHIAACLDIEKCHMESIDRFPLSEEEYHKCFYLAVLCEAHELDSSFEKVGTNLELLFAYFMKKESTIWTKTDIDSRRTHWILKSKEIIGRLPSALCHSKEFQRPHLHPNPPQHPLTDFSARETEK